jgi:hypothetical protein
MSAEDEDIFGTMIRCLLLILRIYGKKDHGLVDKFCIVEWRTKISLSIFAKIAVVSTSSSAKGMVL